MAVTLLHGREALAWGAAHGGASFFAAPSLAEAGMDGALAEETRARGGAAVEAESAAGALEAALDAAARGATSVAAIGGGSLPSAAPLIARAVRERVPLVILVEGAWTGPAGEAEGTAQRELSPLRWISDPAPALYAPASAEEAYGLARAAALLARDARGSGAPVALYLDAALASLREPVETADASRAAPARGSAAAGRAADAAERAAHAAMPESEIYRTRDAVVLAVAAGIAARAARTAVRVARERGLRAGLFRLIRLWPLPQAELAASAERAQRVVVAELNEGQLWEPLAAHLHAGDRRPVVRSLAESGAGALSPERILAALLEEAA
jgi:2-oxoglutarate ferredoxin oxidoreductase subunit alpha